MIFHKCDKKGHIQTNYKYKGNGSSGNLSHKWTNKIPDWVTKNSVVVDVKIIALSAITWNINKYKWGTLWNNGNGAWGSQWKEVQKEWKEKQGNKNSICFYHSATNSIIYWS